MVAEIGMVIGDGEMLFDDAGTRTDGKPGSINANGMIGVTWRVFRKNRLQSRNSREIGVLRRCWVVADTV